MPVIDKMADAPFSIWHDGVLVAIVYNDKVLLNSSEDVEIIFGDADEKKTWMS